MTKQPVIQPTPIHWKYHVIFWVLYSLFWHLIQAEEIFNWRSILVGAVYTLVNILLVYGNVFYLMPRFLYKKKVGLYIITFTIAYLVACLFLFGAILGLFHLYGVENLKSLVYTPAMLGSTLGSNLSAATVSMIIHLIRQRNAQQYYQQRLEKEQLTTELKFLKSQLNPHFLFNALNSIYFLIKKDPDTAANALAGFSDLLRYQLYQTNNDSIPLKQEIENLKKYIQLAALRKSETLNISTYFSEHIGNQPITPLLLLPLVENAFKHVKTGASKIIIDAKVENDMLVFLIKNHYEIDAITSIKKEEGGVGLKNIRRRLELLYPNRYELKIEPQEKWFQVKLKLKF